MPPFAEVAHGVSFAVRGAAAMFVVCHCVAEYVGFVAPCEGPSMLPTLHVQGDWLWVSTRYRRGRGVAVGDVVSIRHPWFPEEYASKRVLGMPGDFVLRDGPATADKASAPVPQGQRMMIQVPEGHCWLAGDNCPWSRDSRDYGPQPLALIKGKAVARIRPWAQRKWIESAFRDVPEGAVASRIESDGS